MAGLGTLGIVVLQAAAAAAAVAFFRRRGEMHWWKTILAPAIGFAGLTVASVLLLMNYSSLTGTSTNAINALPWLLAASVLGGLAYTLWLRRRSPASHAGIAAEGPADDAAPPPRTAPGQVRSGRRGSHLPDPDPAS
jgi:hypothetical protein